MEAFQLAVACIGGSFEVYWTVDVVSPIGFQGAKWRYEIISQSAWTWPQIPLSPVLLSVLTLTQDLSLLRVLTFRASIRVSFPYSPPDLFLCIVFSGEQKNRPYAIFTADHPVIVISSSKNSALFT